MTFDELAAEMEAPQPPYVWSLQPRQNIAASLMAPGLIHLARCAKALIAAHDRSDLTAAKLAYRELVDAVKKAETKAPQPNIRVVK